MIEVNYKKTPRGEKYWVDASPTLTIIAYRYYRADASWTRYKAKYVGKGKSQTVTVRKMMKEYPIAFSMLRDATGTRTYDV